MVSLYNCKNDGNQWRITKFDSDFNVEASYLLDASTCECPAGHRPRCRHREMLPKFIQRNAVGTEWFYDHDRGGWVQGWKEEPELDAETKQAHEHIDEYGEGNPPLASEALPIQQEAKPSTLDMITLAHDEAIVQHEIVEGLSLLDSLAPAGLGQASDPTPSPLHFDKDYSNSIGHSPGYLEPSTPLASDISQEPTTFTITSPSPTIRRRV